MGKLRLSHSMTTLANGHVQKTCPRGEAGVRPARPEIASSVPQGGSFVDARSVHSVREHGKLATCLCETAFSLCSHFGEGGTAKAGNAAGLPAVALA